MKKFYIAIIAIVVVLVGAYFVLSIGERGSGQIDDKNKTTYSSSDIGLEFIYPTGPKGYVLDERMPVDLGTGLVKVIILQSTQDAKNEPPVGGEGSPVITISVFENTKKQFPRAWADKNIDYSNINLKTGEVFDTVVGGANAIRYMADGLYASENVVVAHGDNMYVISGQFLDEDSNMRRDFAPIVESVRFIPAPGQE